MPPNLAAMESNQGGKRQSANSQFATHAELFDLSGKRGLVTGGTRGIGMMIARGLLPVSYTHLTLPTNREV